jgi:hypothetical protein
MTEQYAEIARSVKWKTAKMVAQWVLVAFLVGAALQVGRRAALEVWPEPVIKLEMVE